MSAAGTTTSGPSGDSRKARLLLRKPFSFPVFLGAVLSAGAMAVTVWEGAPIVGGKMFVEGDTWWHLKVGEQILSTHVWPTHDVYSITVHGSPWIAYEWLGDVVMATALHRVDTRPRPRHDARSAMRT